MCELFEPAQLQPEVDCLYKTLTDRPIAGPGLPAGPGQNFVSLGASGPSPP